MGGAEAVLCDLIKTMDASIFEHHVIYFHDGPHAECLEQLGVPMHHIKGFISLYDPLFFKRLYQAIASIKPDCIHTLLWAANNAGRVIGNMLNIPVVSVLHNNVDQDGWFRNMIDKYTVASSHHLIAVSHGVAQSLRKRNTQLPQSKIEIITNGVDMAALHVKNAREQIARQMLGLSQEHFVIGSVGRFMPVKRYDLMLQAFAHVHTCYPQARLVLVGLGDLEHDLRQKAAALAIKDYVHFVIGQPAYRYYTLFDCFALSSDKEGISIALLEAMSFGLPCVVTNSENSHAVLENNKNGIFVPAGDDQQLADAFIKLLENVGLAQQLGAQAQCTVENQFNSVRMRSAYEMIFKSAAHKQLL